MLRGVFVTGTDTGIGKTVVSAALVACMGERLKAGGQPLRYWKPVQTGSEHDDDTADVGQLSGCAPEVLLSRGIRLPRPVSPHLAARLSGRQIVTDEVIAMTDGESADTRWIVEGAGGVLVPLNDSDLMIDLMVRLALPVLVTTRTTLGTINHTLLTLEALRARSLEVAGVVMVGEANATNREAIETYGRVSVVGELPPFDPLSAETLRAWASSHLDRDGKLYERCFA